MTVMSMAFSWQTKLISMHEKKSQCSKNHRKGVLSNFDND